MLRTACFILTGFLTGMRSSEYVTLRKGCATIEGNKVRITGKVYKTSNSTNGKTETWVTVPIVYRAIQILEKLSSSDWLFDTAAGVHNTPKFNYYSGSVAVQRFIEHANEVNKLCKTGDPIPTEIDGERFMVTPASFRRTLAWYIAAQPYGVVAGMLQYKHVQVSTFEGYAGTSASGFKLEVEQAEKAVHQLDMFDKYERVKQGEKLAGSGGAKLTEAFKTIQQELGDYPGLVVDNNRLKILLKTCADKMFSGPLSGCIFDADVALCKPQNVELLEAPLLASCKLLDCSCSVIDTSKLSAWEDRSNKLEQVVINPALLEYQKEYVCRHLEKTKKVIATISSLSSTLPKLPKDKNEH